MDERVEGQDVLNGAEEDLFRSEAVDPWDDFDEESDVASADDIVDSDEELKEDEQPVAQDAAQKSGSNGEFDEAESDKKRFVELAEKYAMSEELATSVMADPARGLPFLQASMHLKIEKAIVGRLVEILPALGDWVFEKFEKKNAGAAKNESFMTSFKEQYPDLASPKLVALVRKEMIATKANFPKLSDARVHAKVASSVRALLETSGKKQQQQRPATFARAVTSSRSGREELDSISKLPVSVRKRLEMSNM